MHGCLFDDGYLNLLYGMRCFVFGITHDPDGNGGCDSGVVRRHARLVVSSRIDD